MFFITECLLNQKMDGNGGDMLDSQLEPLLESTEAAGARSVNDATHYDNDA